MKSILIKTVSDEEFELVEAFIKEHKLQGFTVEDKKPTELDVFNDVARLLIPMIR